MAPDGEHCAFSEAQGEACGTWQSPGTVGQQIPNVARDSCDSISREAMTLGCTWSRFPEPWRPEEKLLLKNILCQRCLEAEDGSVSVPLFSERWESPRPKDKESADEVWLQGPQTLPWSEAVGRGTDRGTREHWRIVSLPWTGQYSQTFQ